MLLLLTVSLTRSLPCVCVQGGLLVLSVRSSGGSSPSKTGSGGSSLVTHYSLSSAALQSSGLEGLLERNGAAEQLLDTTTGERGAGGGYSAAQMRAVVAERYSSSGRRQGV